MLEDYIWPAQALGWEASVPCTLGLTVHLIANVCHQREEPSFCFSSKPHLPWQIEGVQLYSFLQEKWTSQFTLCSFPPSKLPPHEMHKDMSSPKPSPKPVVPQPGHCLVYRVTATMKLCRRREMCPWKLTSLRFMVVTVNETSIIFIEKIRVIQTKPV